MTKSYKELMSFKSFKGRFEYLRISGLVGDLTFGGRRWLNQQLYKSDAWKRIRRNVILRDEGLDLGFPGHEIFGRIYIHHINPITDNDILERSPCVFDLENLISVSFETHNAIHYGSEVPEVEFIQRRPNDTCPWRR